MVFWVEMADFPIKTKEDVKLLLEKFSEPFEFLGEGRGRKYTLEDGFRQLQPHGFHSRIRCSLTPPNTLNFDYAKSFKHWINLFSSYTATNWISDQGRKPGGKTRIASARFVCHLAPKNKRKVDDRKEDKRNGILRKNYKNLGCSAVITFSVNNICRSALRPDRDGYYLNRARPLDTEIEIKFQHTHPLRNQLVLSALKSTKYSKGKMFGEKRFIMTAVRPVFHAELEQSIQATTAGPNDDDDVQSDEADMGTEEAAPLMYPSPTPSPVEEVEMESAIYAAEHAFSQALRKNFWNLKDPNVKHTLERFAQTCGSITHVPSTVILHLKLWKFIRNSQYLTLTNPNTLRNNKIQKINKKGTFKPKISLYKVQTRK